jgi:serine protease inhibitor
MKTFFLLLIAFMLTSAHSCQKEDQKPEEYKFITLDEKSAQLVEADNAFGLELFQQIRNDSREENLMISPLSVSVALAMAYNGAEKDTRKEMEETLKLKGLTKEQINASYKKLITAMQSLDEDVVFEMANAIFYASGFSVKPNFLQVNQTIYQAEVEDLNFNDPAAVHAINDWVAEKTHDKIQKIIEKLNPLDRMVLLNAIYFYGTWTKPFNAKGTHELFFNKKDGTQKKVPMMNKTDKLPYASNNLFKAIKIPYGIGQYNMVVLLPVGGNTSQNIIDAFSPSNWESWMGSFEVADKVEVTMPRFKYAFEISLNKVLKQLGMPKAFIPEIADFTGISDEELYISEVIHKSYIDVNETGTEAAAVTSVGFATTSMPSEQPIPFFVDRPFVYAITEDDTGAILFIGEVNNPKYD